MSQARPARRVFFARSGALVAAIVLSPRGFARPAKDAGAVAFGERIEIHPDGKVYVKIGRIEMGQGLDSAIAQLAAEELDVSIGRVVVPPVDTDVSPNEGYTDSSASMRSTGAAVRQAGARARAALLDMAAQRAGKRAGELAVADGTIYLDGVRLTTYWQLLAERRPTVPPMRAAPLKSPAQYRLIGRNLPRSDLPGKVTGAPAFIQDVRLPGMLHARVLRPPGHGAELIDIDAGLVSAMPGVAQVVRKGSFVAVAAEREEQAVAALETLRAACKWRGRADVQVGRRDVASHLREQAGMARAAPERDGRLSAEYDVPYRMHGSIGPSCAVAHLAGQQLTVWSHAQGMYPLRSSLAGLTGLAASRIRCIHVQGAGCYGHNGADDAAADAALIALALPGRPVRVQWMREDEHQWEPYGPAMAMRVSGAVDARGRITDWDYAVASPTHSSRPGGAMRLLAGRHAEPSAGSGLLQALSQWAGGAGYNAEPYYDIGAAVDTHLVRHAPLRASALRSLGAYANVFAIESFMDELARAAGKDPLSFRLAHLPEARARAVLELAARRYGWGASGNRPGQGSGIAFARLNNYGAYVAVAMQAHAQDGKARITRAVAAVDCGEAVNPDGVRSQIEGGIVQAISWTMLEAVDFDTRRVRSTDWDSYPILRITEAPEVEVHVMDRPGLPCLGVGEAAQGPAGAACAIAAAAALGRPVRSLPVSGLPAGGS